VDGPIAGDISRRFLRDHALAGNEQHKNETEPKQLRFVPHRGKLPVKINGFCPIRCEIPTGHRGWAVEIDSHPVDEEEKSTPRPR
jgi:hypothetical protein